MGLFDNSSQTTQTTQSQGPNWQVPYQRYGLDQALASFQGINSPQQLVAGFSPLQNEALSNIQGYANSNPLGSAQSYVSSILNPGFTQGSPYGAQSGAMAGTMGGGGTPGPTMYNGQPVGPNNLPSGWSYQNGNIYGPQYGPSNPAPGHLGISAGSAPTQQPSGFGGPQMGGQGSFGGGNPWLDQMFNQGANAVQNRLSSEFAGAGRNIIGSAPVQSDSLNDLATKLYGGAYNTEVQQQENALANAQSLANTNMGLQQGLFGAGQQIQNLGQQYIQAPQDFLNQYLNRVNGYMGSTQSTQQPVTPFQQIGQAYMGAGLGQQIGSALGNYLGGSNGGSIGGLLGTAAGAFL